MLSSEKLHLSTIIFAIRRRFVLRLFCRSSALLVRWVIWRSLVCRFGYCLTGSPFAWVFGRPVRYSCRCSAACLINEAADRNRRQTMNHKPESLFFRRWGEVGRKVPRRVRGTAPVPTQKMKCYVVRIPKVRIKWLTIGLLSVRLIGG